MNTQDDLQPRYPMNRRTFMGMVAAGAASTLFQGAAAAAQPTPKARNVVLVHGLFADGSSWSEVIARLQAAGLNATSVQNPDDAAGSGSFGPARAGSPGWSDGSGRTFLLRHDCHRGGDLSERLGPCLCGGAKPDAGEDYAALAKTFPTPPASAGVVFDGDEGRLTEAAFLRDFAGDLPEAKAKVLYAVQEPFQGAARGQDHASGLAVEAKFLCRFHGRPNDQSRSRALHGQAWAPRPSRSRPAISR